MKTVLLRGLIALILILAATSAFATGRGEVNEDLLISADELSEILDHPRTVIIDAREFAGYSQGFIPGAVNIYPRADLDHTTVLDDGTEVEALVLPAEDIIFPLQDAGINRNSRVVIYDSGASSLAPRVFWTLDYYGHRNVAILNGGLPAWEAAGGALSTEIVDVEPGNFVPRPNEDKIADFEYVSAAISGNATMVCNALSERSYESGAIPRSTNLSYGEFFPDDGVPLLAQADVLDELLNDIGYDRSKEIVFYCGRGYAASVDYFAARYLGIENVRLYDGSLRDWNARGGELLPSGGV